VFANVPNGATRVEAQAVADRICISCHSGSAPAAGMDLSAAAGGIGAQIGVASGGCPTKTRIVAGSAATSYLIDKVLGTAQDLGCFAGLRMPRNQDQLSPGDIATLQSWINGGAL